MHVFFSAGNGTGRPAIIPVTMVVGIFDSTSAKESYMLKDIEGNLTGMVFN